MRNYKKEVEWRKKKYDVLRVTIDKELGNKFRDKLKREHKTISSFFKSKIEEFLK